MGSVRFHCTLTNGNMLIFRCQGRSVSVLVEKEESVRLVDDDDDDDDDCATMDPFFFDQGYMLAGSTGFQVWAGLRLLLETLITWPSASQQLWVNEDSNL